VPVIWSLRWRLHARYRRHVRRDPAYRRHLLIRQLQEPHWKCIRYDDSVPCDRCHRYCFVVWEVFEIHYCPECVTEDDLEPDALPDTSNGNR
jgi:hypothetical protein